jgi:hypothetical protein
MLLCFVIRHKESGKMSDLGEDTRFGLVAGDAARYQVFNSVFHAGKEIYRC